MDHQFIHVDPERVARQTPFGSTIAHGFLTLSLSVHLESPEMSEIEGVGFVINYGLDKLRFINRFRWIRAFGFTPRSPRFGREGRARGHPA